MKAKAEIVKLKFKVPKDYKDPLKTVTNEDSFDEIQCEEWRHYYNIYLGVPIEKRLMTLEFIGTCSDREIAQIAEKGGRRFSYKRLVKLIKEQYPDMYKALSLDSYNPWWEQSHRINYEGELYVNLIWSDIDHIFKIT